MFQTQRSTAWATQQVVIRTPPPGWLYSMALGDGDDCGRIGSRLPRKWTSRGEGVWWSAATRLEPWSPTPKEDRRSTSGPWLALTALCGSALGFHAFDLAAGRPAPAFLRGHHTRRIGSTHRTRSPRRSRSLAPHRWTPQDSPAKFFPARWRDDGHLDHRTTLEDHPMRSRPLVSLTAVLIAARWVCHTAAGADGGPSAAPATAWRSGIHHLTVDGRGRALVR